MVQNEETKKKKKIVINSCNVDGSTDYGFVNNCNNSFNFKESDHDSSIMNQDPLNEMKIKFRLTYETFLDLLLYDSPDAVNRYGISIIKTSNLVDFIDILQTALLWDYLRAFSIQIDVPKNLENDNYIFLLFKSEQKSNIFKNQTSVKQLLEDKFELNNKIKYNFLQSDELETCFLTIENEIDKNYKKGFGYFIEPKDETNDNNSMFIIDYDQKHMSVLDFYNIYFPDIIKKKQFFDCFLYRFSHVFKKGLLIFNFRLKDLSKDTQKIFSCSGCFINTFGFNLYGQRKSNHFISLEDKLDDFNNLKVCCGLERFDANDKSYQKMLWRQSITSDYFPFRQVKEIFY